MPLLIHGVLVSLGESKSLLYNILILYSSNLNLNFTLIQFFFSILFYLLPFLLLLALISKVENMNSDNGIDEVSPNENICIMIIIIVYV